jgi:cytochrome c biogenesis protein CcmG/thiol:disulfide interchange protein DsbE
MRSEMPASQQLRTANASTSRYLFFLAPLLALMSIAAVFGTLLTRDPELVPSALIGKLVPAFSLPPVKGRMLGLASENFYGEVSLVNVFASWCVACREEHPQFMWLAQNKIISVHGLNYKDRPEDASKWLDTMGDPYVRTGADQNGRVAIDWGVYGVPETFLVGSDGIVAYKHIGAVTKEVLTEKILPLASNCGNGGQHRVSRTELNQAIGGICPAR